MEKKNKNRKPYKKPITKCELQDPLNFAVSDLETVDYNNDTSLNNLEPVSYNHDTSIIDLTPIKNLKQLKKKMTMKKMVYRL